MDTPPKGYRRNVGICLINSSKKIFAASRLDIPDAWQMPQGGIDENEDPRNAAIRELREETGVTSADIVAEIFKAKNCVDLNCRTVREEGTCIYAYADLTSGEGKAQAAMGFRLEGSSTEMVSVKFTGKDEEVNLLGDGTEKAEFGQWSWISPQEIVDRAVDFKKPVYEEVIKVFSPHLQ
ncbi:nudix hydrolase-like protein 26 [Perilla frutescens var. hirtella]|nr:nudix hydrolase-like protein 26 [Perilla frutescens var. hirtella]